MVVLNPLLNGFNTMTKTLGTIIEFGEKKLYSIVLKNVLMKLNSKINIFLSFSFLVFFSCNRISEAYEKIESNHLKEQFIDTKLCDEFTVTNIEFDNNPSDNKGVFDLFLRGTVTIDNTFERVIVFESGNNDNYVYRIYQESEESIQKRFIEFLSKNNFFSEQGAENENLHYIKFSENGTGEYKSDDGDTYVFDYRVSETHNYNQVENIDNNSSCDEIRKVLKANLEDFYGSFEMSNNRFTLNGKIRYNQEENKLTISGKILSKEDSSTEEIELTLYKE